MKKMICEICGSQRILKKDGIFACQECGTEYSLEEARLLLKDIDSNITDKNNDLNVKIVKSDTDKYQAIDYLSSWLKCISVFEKTTFWTGNSFYNGILNNDLNRPITNDYVSSIVNTKKRIIPMPDDDDFYKVTTNCFNYNQFYNGAQTFRTVKDMFENHKNTKKTIEALREYKDATWTGTFGKMEYKNVIYSTDGSYRVLIHNIPYGDEFNYLIKLSLSSKTYKCQSKIAKGLIGFQWADTTVEPFNLTNTINMIRGYINEFKERHRALIKHYNDNFESIIAIFKETQKYISDLETRFNLPEKYRNTGIICRLLDIFIDGRADTWKEALNLFEMERRMDLLIVGVKEICNKLDGINEKLSDISYKLSSINMNINQLFIKATSIEENTRRIMYDTRWKVIMGY